MVLIVRRELLSRLSQSPVVQAFAGYFLLGKTPPAEIPGTNERDRITIEAIRSIALNDPQVFEPAYSDIQRRQINDQADWIFDDYLMFALITAGLKATTDLTFVQKALETRRALQSGLEAETTDALLHLAKQHKIDPPSPIVLVGRHFANQIDRDETTLRAVYSSATRLLAESHDEFTNIICMTAVDIVIASSPLIPEIPSLFWREFNRRITFVASALHTFASVLLMAAWFGAVVHYFATDIRLLEKLFTTGLLVFPAAFLWQRKRVVAVTRRLIIRIFGGAAVSRVS